MSPEADVPARALVAPELLPGLDLLPALDLSDEGLLELQRTQASRHRSVEGDDAWVRCEEHHVPGPAGAPEVRVLVYRPLDGSEGPRPAYLHLHGGGFVLGEPESFDLASRALSRRHGCVVVSVDYRLAPATRWPGAREDAYAALRWLHDNADTLGVDARRIAIGGESAGGGHAAALALVIRDRGELHPCLQLLDSPALDDRTGSTHPPHPWAGQLVWTAEQTRAAWRALLGVEPGGPEVPAAAVPARVEDLAGVAPAFLVVGALDLFCEETVDYARRLMRAGVPTELHVLPGAYHGFALTGLDAPQVRELFRLRDAALSRAFGAALQAPATGREPDRATATSLSPR